MSDRLPNLWLFAFGVSLMLLAPMIFSEVVVSLLVFILSLCMITYSLRP